MKPRPRRSRRTAIGLTLLLMLMPGPARGAEAVIEKHYAPTLNEIANPERGLYVQFTAREDAAPLEVDALEKLREDKITLLLRLYYFKEFRNGPIDSDRLTLIRQDLAKIRAAGMKCILRFAYNEAIGEADAPIDVVLRHTAQLAPILRENADVIAVAQAGFVGSWGEWHASTHDLREPGNAKRIIAAWLEALPADRYVQVRTPGIKAMLVGDFEPLAADEAWTGTPRSRIAHHNDCFLATFNDMGTYEDVDAEKAYLEQETRTLPMGGETCHVSEFIAVGNARDEFRRFHWSYLNLGYHPEVLQRWREEGFLEEVRTRLGYRLVLERAAVAPVSSAGGGLNVELDLRNDGWAAPFNPREVTVLLKSVANGYAYSFKLDVDPRAWEPGTPIEIRERVALPVDLPPGLYAVHLALPDPEPRLATDARYAIRLGNKGIWDEKTGQHDLDLTVRVRPGDSAAE